jgi:hypothetical protein
MTMSTYWLPERWTLRLCGLDPSLGDLVDLRNGDSHLNDPAADQRPDRDVPANLLVELLTAPTDRTIRRRVLLAGTRIIVTLDLHTARLARSLLLRKGALSSSPSFYATPTRWLLSSPAVISAAWTQPRMRWRSELDLSGVFTAQGRSPPVRCPTPAPVQLFAIGRLFPRNEQTMLSMLGKVGSLWPPDSPQRSSTQPISLNVVAYTTSAVRPRRPNGLMALHQRH